jgi:hypothetical protein
MGPGIFADIASMPWAWTLHSLFRIIKEFPTEDPNQDLTDLTMEKTAEKLESFIQIRVRSQNSTQTAIVARPTFFCKFHGNNPTHESAKCKAHK